MYYIYRCVLEFVYIERWAHWSWATVENRDASPVIYLTERRRKAFLINILHKW